MSRPFIIDMAKYAAASCLEQHQLLKYHAHKTVFSHRVGGSSPAKYKV